MVVLQQMVIFFILMAVGFAARRASLLPREMLPVLSGLIANLAGPCLILSGVTGNVERMPLSQALFALAVFAVLLVAMMLVGRALPALLRYPREERPCMNFATWMTNIGYIGLPFAASVYGPHAQIYVVLYLIPNNLLLYSYAIWLMQTNARETGEAGGMNLRGLLNPGLIATLLTVVLYFGGLSLPHVVAAPIEMLGAMTAPLSMMLVGAMLVDERPTEVVRDGRLGLFIVLKMIAVPVLTVLALHLVVADMDLLAACMSVVAMPSGVLVSAYSLLYDPPRARMAARTVALTTFLSVATIPLVALAVGL